MTDFKYLVREPQVCGGQTRIQRSRMRPIDVVGYIQQFGLKEFKIDWGYIPEEAIEECFRYLKVDWSKYENS